MLISGHLLLEATDASCHLVPGIVRVHDGVIAEVICGETTDHCDLGGHEAVILPGLIDAHVHLPQFDLIGSHGMPLLDWLHRVTFPSEGKWQDVTYARSMTQRVIDQCLAHGTTAFCAYATVHHQSAVAALEVATVRGMRGVIGQVLMDREAPSYLIREANQLIDEAARASDQFPPTMRMSAAVTPRFAIACTEPLLRMAGDLARERQTLVQTHLSENVAECELVKSMFDGRGYVEVYENSGLLLPRTIFGHGIHLDATDHAALRTSGSLVAHCPTANSFLQSGVMNRAAMMADEVKVVLGSDIGAGYERSMVRVARSMIEAAANLGTRFPSPAEAWHLITAGNADQLGFSDVGRIQPGLSADLVMVKPNIPWQQAPMDPLGMLMFSWDDRWIEQVVLQGNCSGSESQMSVSTAIKFIKLRLPSPPLCGGEGLG